MEMETVTFSLEKQLKEQVEAELEKLGLTWKELAENFVGREASPSVDRALKEAYESGDYPKTYTNVDELFNDMLGVGWDA